MSASEYRYTLLFEPAEEGGYVVTCPALAGLVTEGDTFEGARAMGIDAIRGYLEALTKDGLPFPADDQQTNSPLKKETVTIAVEGV